MDFKVEDRVEILESDESELLEDVYGVPKGAKGTVIGVNSANKGHEIHVKFDEVYQGNDMLTESLYLPKEMFKKI